MGLAGMSIKATTTKMLHKFKNVEKNTNKMRSMKIMKKEIEMELVKRKYLK